MVNLATLPKHLVMAFEPVPVQPCFQRTPSNRNYTSASLLISFIGKSRLIREMVGPRCEPEPGDQLFLIGSLPDGATDYFVACYRNQFDAGPVLFGTAKEERSASRIQHAGRVGGIAPQSGDFIVNN
ncbi:MAG: hypothetical protein ACREIC_29140, partial [Limisphaerales bacterium]